MDPRGLKCVIDRFPGLFVAGCCDIMNSLKSAAWQPLLYNYGPPGSCVIMEQCMDLHVWLNLSLSIQTQLISLPALPTWYLIKSDLHTACGKGMTRLRLDCKNRIVKLLVLLVINLFFILSFHGCDCFFVLQHKTILKLK